MGKGHSKSHPHSQYFQVVREEGSVVLEIIHGDVCDEQGGDGDRLETGDDGDDSSTWIVAQRGKAKPKTSEIELR